ncbi:MAG TPA: GNAT family N-acetyltransferase [Methanoregula sp.]|nr:GNAT family N-acetyltransferase [Methanoregula sp.]
MITWLAQAYRDLSYERKQWIIRFFSPAKFVLTAVSDLFFHVYKVSGDANAVFITSLEPDTSFVRYFYPDATLQKTRTIFAWSLPGEIRRSERAIIALNRNLVPFFRNGVFTVPFVRQVVSLDKPPETLKQFRKHKKTIQSYTAEISNDAEHLKFFYEQMYLPFIRERHKDALIEDISKLQYLLKKNGELILLRHQQELVGGLFCKRMGGTYYALSVGLIDDRWLSEDAVPALFYHSMIRARELNARFVDFGESRPFLSDGVLEYKRRWGGRVIRNERDNYYYLLKNVARDGLIYIEEQGLAALVSPESARSFLSHPDPGIQLRIMGGEGKDTPVAGEPVIPVKSKRTLAFVYGLANRIHSYQKSIIRR